MLWRSLLGASRGASRAARAQSWRVMAHHNEGMLLGEEGRETAEMIASSGTVGADRPTSLGKSLPSEGVAISRNQHWPVPLSPLPPPHANAIEQGRADRARALFARLAERESSAQLNKDAVRCMTAEPEAASSEHFPLLPVLHEDDDIVAIMKPSGLYCEDVAELLKRMLQRRAALVEAEMVALTLMHRLDRDTSGVMLLSKTPAATKSLSKGFSTHSAQKTYIALGFCRGPPPDWTAQTLRTGELRVE